MPALVVHASKNGEESRRTLYIGPIIAVAKARGLVKAGWQVHIVDADGGVFHPDKFISFSVRSKACDQILSQ